MHTAPRSEYLWNAPPATDHGGNGQAPATGQEFAPISLYNRNLTYCTPAFCDLSSTLATLAHSLRPGLSAVRSISSPYGDLGNELSRRFCLSKFTGKPFWTRKMEQGLGLLPMNKLEPVSRRVGSAAPVAGRLLHVGPGSGPRKWVAVSLEGVRMWM